MNKDNVMYCAYDRYTNKIEFNINKALIYLLEQEVIFIEKSDITYPEGGSVCYTGVWTNDSILVYASILFTVSYEDIRLLYHLVKKDPEYGKDIWCMLKENRMLDWKYKELIEKENIWDLEQLRRVFKLKPSYNELREIEENNS